MANKLRVQSSTEYIIEVNDNGDTISLDPSDTTLMSRALKAFEEIERLSSAYNQKVNDIASTENKVIFEKDEIKITEHDKQGAELISEFYSETRKHMDSFLGKGACQKIFGDKNWLTMFEDLTDQLKPHFDKMGLNLEKARKSAVQKHAPNRAAKRALK